MIDAGTDNPDLRNDKFYLVSASPVALNVIVPSVTSACDAVAQQLVLHSHVRLQTQGAKKDRIRGEEQLQIVE